MNGYMIFKNNDSEITVVDIDIAELSAEKYLIKLVGASNISSTTFAINKDKIDQYGAIKDSVICVDLKEGLRSFKEAIKKKIAIEELKFQKIKRETDQCNNMLDYILYMI